METPSSIPFKLYQPTLFTDFSIIDYDRDTQLGILRLETVTSYFFVNTSLSNPNNPVRWIKGNYGEDMDDTMTELEGSLSALHAILQNITFRGIYKLNDTLVVTITDGDFIVQRRVLLEYIAEQEPIVTSRFWIIMSVIVVLIVLWVASILFRLCSFCCCCSRKKELPLQKSKELEMTTLPKIETSPKTSEDNVKPSQSIVEGYPSDPSTLAKKSIRPSMEQSFTHPVVTAPATIAKKIPPVVPTIPPARTKKTPPPLPSSLPPELPPISRNAVRPSSGAPK